MASLARRVCASVSSGNVSFWNEYFEQIGEALKVIQYWVEQEFENKIATTQTFLVRESGYPTEVSVGHYGDRRARKERDRIWWEQWGDRVDPVPTYGPG